MSDDRDDGGPREGDLLAPWRSVGKLDAKDSALFDRLMAEEPEMARRLEVAMEERDAVVALNEALPSPSAAARERLFARIEAEAGARRAARGGLGRWLSARLTGLAPSTLAWGAAAAAVVIAVQAGLLTNAYLGDGPGYRTASDGLGAAATGQTALVAFAPAATADDIARLLGETGAEIVGGPKPGGVFLVRIAEKPLAGAELDAALKRLTDRPAIVRFAAPGG